MDPADAACFRGNFLKGIVGGGAREGKTRPSRQKKSASGNPRQKTAPGHGRHLPASSRHARSYRVHATIMPDFAIFVRSRSILLPLLGCRGGGRVCRFDGCAETRDPIDPQPINWAYFSRLKLLQWLPSPKLGATGNTCENMSTGKHPPGNGIGVLGQNKLRPAR